eukprot:1070695-Heterocapsa_arctica.AAC.1
MSEERLAAQLVIVANRNCTDHDRVVIERLGDAGGVTVGGQLLGVGDHRHGQVTDHSVTLTNCVGFELAHGVVDHYRDD